MPSYNAEVVAGFNKIDPFFGRIDQIADLSIGTRFWHVDFVPLVPLKSFVLLDRGTGRSFPLPRLAWRSVLRAWLRTLAAAVFLAALFLVTTIEGLPRIIAAFALSISAGTLFLSYRRSEVPFERAARWVTMAGRPAELVMAVERHYGRSLAEVTDQPVLDWDTRSERP